MNLITGGSGFIGSHIARYLSSAGEAVRILDVRRPDQAHLNHDIHFVPADLRDAKAVKDACKGVKRIFHIAALVPISKAGKKFWDVNVQGTWNVLEGAVAHRVPKILHMSSSAIYDIDQPHPLTEQSPLKPLGVYAASKLDAEQVCLDYRAKGLDISLVRPRTVIGPERLGIFSILFDWIQSGKNIYIIGNGQNKIQFVHVADLAEACVKISEQTSNEAFNVGTDRFNSLREDLGQLIAHASTRSKIAPIHPALAMGTLRVLDTLRLSPLADWHYYSYHKDFYFDLAHIRSKIDWAPKFSNIEMLIEAFDWYRQFANHRQKRFGVTHNFALKQAFLRLLKFVS
jgi:nucleoside-diphosphate-sugar epimerase